MNMLTTLAAGLSLAVVGISTAQACPESLDFRFKQLASDNEVHLCEAYAGKVVLVVNTASKCGYTYQYDGLEALYEKHRDQGLVVIGFPSNDFGRQEPGSEKQIQAFCRLTYGVKFPMFEKSHVARGQANAFYDYLARQTGEYPQWNFHKYLIDRKGQVTKSFSSKVEPQGPELTRAVLRLLQEE